MKTTCSEVYPEYRPQQVCYNTFLIFANLVIMREEQTNKQLNQKANYKKGNSLLVLRFLGHPLTNLAGF